MHRILLLFSFYLFGSCNNAPKVTALELKNRTFSFVTNNDSVWVSFLDSTCSFYSTQGARWTGKYVHETILGNNYLTVNDHIQSYAFLMDKDEANRLTANLIGSDFYLLESTTKWTEVFIDYDKLQGDWISERTIPPPPPVESMTEAQSLEYLQSKNYKLSFRGNSVYLTQHGFVDSANFNTPFLTLYNQSNLNSLILGRGSQPSQTKLIFIKTLNDSTLEIDHVVSNYGSETRRRTTFKRNM